MPSASYWYATFVVPLESVTLAPIMRFWESHS